MLDKAIEKGREHRKQWRRSKRFDPTCRNHGGCPWCEANRLHQQRKEAERAEESVREFRDSSYL